MRIADKLASELLEWYKTSRPFGAKEYDRLRTIWIRGLAGVPFELADDVFAEFLARCSDSKDMPESMEPIKWLTAVGSVLLQDYNGEALSHDDWVQLRDMVNSSAGIMDIDELNYVMQLVVEHGAIH